MCKLYLTVNPHVPASTTSMGIIDRISLAIFKRFARVILNIIFLDAVIWGF